MPHDDTESSERRPLDHRLRSSSRYLLIAQISGQLLSIGTLAICYRLLSPADFGTIALVLPVVMLGRMLATQGLNVAAIQAEQMDDLTRSHLFWSGIRWSVVAMLGCGVLVPLLPWSQGAYDAIAVGLVLTGTIFVVAAGTQHQSRLERVVQLDRLAVFRVIAQLLGSVAAVVSAFTGFGVWSLVVQQYLENASLTVMLWWNDPWRPGWTVPPETETGLLKFSGYYSLSGLVFYLAQNLDKFVLGAMLGATESGRAILGMYSQAYQWMQKPVLLSTGPISAVMLPLLSRSRSKQKQFAQWLSDCLQLTSLVLFPCGIGLLVVADDAMRLLGGDDWEKAGTLLHALALSILGQGLINLCGSILAAVGRADRLFWSALVILVLMTQGHLFAYLISRDLSNPLGPALAVAWSVTLVTTLVIALPYTVLCVHFTGVNVLPVLSRWIRPLLAAIVMGLLVAWSKKHMVADDWNLSIRLFAQVGLGAVVYLVLVLREVGFTIKRFLGRTE